MCTEKLLDLSASLNRRPIWKVHGEYYRLLKMLDMDGTNTRFLFVLLISNRPMLYSCELFYKLLRL